MSNIEHISVQNSNSSIFIRDILISAVVLAAIVFFSLGYHVSQYHFYQYLEMGLVPQKAEGRVVWSVPEGVKK